MPHAGQPQKQPQEAYDIWQQSFQRRDEPQFAWKSVVSQYLALPALRAFWPMSSVDYAAATQGRDVSGGAYHLTNNNASLFGYDITLPQFLIPRVDFNGTTQYLSRADGGAANWADIIGTETYITAQQCGLTMGCWVRFDDATEAAVAYIMAKFGAAGARSYRLMRRAPGAGSTINFGVSNDCTNTVDVESVTIPSNDAWYFIAGRFTPSTELAIWINPATPTADNTQLIGVPAALCDSAAPLTIGASGVVGSYIDCKVSLAFLCACAVSNVTIWQLYQQSRVMFGR